MVSIVNMFNGMEIGFEISRRKQRELSASYQEPKEHRYETSMGGQTR
jgi:hypothetical protein